MLTAPKELTKAEITANPENEQVLRSLAVEMAREMNDAEDILERYSLSKDEFETIAQTRTFKLMFEQALKEWGAASNTAERVKIKSAALIEEALPLMFAELKETSHPLSSRADLFGRIARIGALGNAPVSQGGSGEVFKIEINLGDDKKITVQQTLPSKVIDDAEYEEL